MSLKHVLEILSVVDSPKASGDTVRELFAQRGWTEVQVQTVQGSQGSTDFVKVTVPGRNGKSRGGSAPTLGVVGRLGGLGARPAMIGLVSDGDGAVAALAAALKLVDMHMQGDVLEGDVVITTHVCPNAPTQPHDPVPFMGSPVDMAVMNAMEVTPEMDAILSIDTTKGNRLVNHRGIAITSPVKEGWILRITDDLLNTYQIVCGHAPVVVPINMQDITPYGNGIHHINSIMQPSVATTAPVVGVAITTESAVPGCATGASHEVDIALAVRFVLEVAKSYGQGKFKFYDEQEFNRLLELYGSMKILQTLPGNS
ncbi:MAG TPA: DUF1177 domain-containing protein [Symbiobacteriaceae bacterium]